MLNVDLRINSLMRLLLTEKERLLHSGYIECDTNTYPLFSAGDQFIDNEEDLHDFLEHGVGVIGLAESLPVFEEWSDNHCMSEDLLDAL